MAEAERAGRGGTRWAVRLAVALAVVAILAGIAAVAIHTSPVRRYVLRRAITSVEETAHIRVHAEDLTYNLLALRMTLRGVRVAAVSVPDEPLFVADRVTVALSGGLLERRTRSFRLQPEDRIDIEGGRVRIVRAPDGRLNLPESPAPAGTPQPLELGIIAAPRLAFEFVDPSNHLSLALPATDITVDGNDGRIELREPGRVARAGTSTTVREINGGLGFDGRTLTLTGLAVAVDEAALTVNGQVGVLTDTPRVDLRIAGRGEVARLARWADLADPPRGDVQIDAVVAGPFEQVGADVKARMRDLNWQGVAASDVSSVMRVTADALDVQQIDAAVFGGRVAGAAVVPFADGDMRANLSWATLDLEALLRTFAPDVLPRPTGRATGALAAHGPGTDFDRWTIDASTRTGGGITARNRVAPQGTVDLLVERRQWRVRADERVSGILARARLHGALNTNRLERSTLAGTITIPEVATNAVLDLLRRTGLAAIEAAPIDGTVRADVTVSGTLGAPSFAARGEGRIADVAPLMPDTPLGGSADLQFEATVREARIQAALNDFNATATGVIDLRAPYHATIDVAARSVDLARALRGVETPVAITGAVSASGRITGPIEDWQRGRASLEVSNLDAQAGALPIRLAAPLRLEYGDETVTVMSLEVLAGDTRVSGSGALPLRASRREEVALTSVQVTATGDLAQFTSAVAATGLVELPDVSGTGPAALLAQITGSLEAPRVAADLELGPGTLRSAELPPATDVHLRARSDGAWIDLRELRAVWQGSRIEATGRMPIAMISDARPGPSPGATPPAAVLTARLTSVTPQVLAPFLDVDTLSQIEGSVDASLRAESRSLDLAAVTGEVQLDRMDVRIADLPIAQRVPTRITVEDGFARVAAWEWTGPGGSLGIQGRIRLVDRQAALVATGRFDLRMLTPFVRGAGMTTAGIVEPRLSITGELSDPRVDGDVMVSAGELRLADPRLVATALAARAVVARTTAQLTQLSGSVNGGMLSGTGTVAFAPNSPLEGTLALTVDGMAIEFPEGLRSELSAALGISVLVPVTDTAAPTGSVKGTVTVLRSAYREPLAVVTGVLNALRTRRLAAEAGAAEPSLIDNLVLDVRVLTDEDIVVDNNLGRLQLGTDLRVIGTVAAPSVAGRAQLREGGRLYFGRNIYVIESGTIDFANPVTVEPDVSIRARTRAGGEDIVLTLKGTPETLETDLEAPDSPELGEADLYSLLLTGRRLDEVSGDEAQIVGEQVLGYLSGDVLGFAGRAVGLDTIRLGGIDEDVLRRDPTAVATELDPTTRLTFGKSFGRDFDLTYSQSLRDSDAQAWILDYRPFRAVETRFVSDDDNLRSYEVRHDVSIGGGSLSDRPTRATTAPRPELRVTGVAVRGSGPIPERRVTSALRLKAGDTFDFGEWQLDRERLEALYHGEAYYEARINAQRSENGNAVALDYEVAPGPHGRVEVTGLRLGEDTMDRIRTAWSQSVVDAFLVDEVQEIVAGDLAREGYLQARVEVSFRLKAEATGEDSFTGGFRRQPEDPEEKTLSITIEPGPRATAYHVTIDAPDPGLVEELTEIVRDRRLDRMASTDSAAVQRELTAHLRAGGYLQARVSVRPPTLEAGQAQIRVNVDPGRRFTIADIVFAGASRVPTQTLLSESNLVPGAPFDPAAVDAARGRIVAWYRREGFARATVGVRQVPREDVAGIAVAFDIDEGPRQVVAEIDVQGSRGVDADVVTRALDLQVNQPLAANAWLDARRRVFDTGLFRRVDVAAEEIGAAPPGADMQPMRVRVNVQPWPALRLRYGFQVAEQRPEGEVEGRELVPGLAADLTRRTLFGRAVTLGAAIEYDRREQAGRAFLSAPTMFGWPIESLVVLERSRETFTADTLTTDRTGVALEQRFRLVPDLRLSVTYRFERDHTFDTGEPDPIVGPRDITVRVARLNASAAFDTRNDPVDATRGMLLSSSFDYAPAALGTEFRFVKHLAQAYYFRQWRRLVFASAARFGVAGALDDQVLLLSERFTAGGAHSVRGAAEDGLGPRDFFGATGGEAVVVLNQEVRFPIYRWLRGVGFVDAGNVFERRSDIDLGALVGSAGFGLRLETPFALLRVDYGRLFSPGPGTGRSGRWMFGIGQAF